MKKLLIPSFFFLFANTIAAQEIWLETALKGGAGTSFLLNKNILDDNTYRNKLTPMYGLGGKVAVNFGPWHGISLEALYSKSAQKWDYTLPNVTGDLQNKVEWKAIEAYLLYRYIRNRTYIEAGPMYSLVQSVKQTDNGTETPDSDRFYEDNYLAGVFGFGGYLGGSETFSVGMGLRLHYGFTDFVSDEGKSLGYPNPVKSKPYDATSKTHPVVAQLLLEFNFGIGHWARTSCSQRMKFFRN